MLASSSGVASDGATAPPPRLPKTTSVIRANPIRILEWGLGLCCSATEAGL